MTQHDHTEYVPGCFRCDLSELEITAEVTDVDLDHARELLSGRVIGSTARVAAALAEERAKALATLSAPPGASGGSGDTDPPPSGDPAQAPTPGKGTVA